MFGLRSLVLSSNPILLTSRHQVSHIRHQIIPTWSGTDADTIGSGIAYTTYLSLPERGLAHCTHDTHLYDALSYACYLYVVTRL